MIQDGCRTVTREGRLDSRRDTMGRNQAIAGRSEGLTKEPRYPRQHAARLKSRAEEATVEVTGAHICE